MKEEKNTDIVKMDESGEMQEVIEDGFLRVTLRKPVSFEGKQYEKIDLSGMEEITAADMIAVNRMLNRKGNVDFLQEMTLEYALNLAARATGMPIEFFENLPPYAAMQVKSRVTGFLYGQA